MKKNINMRVDFLEDGQIFPLMFVDDKSNIVRIDRIIESNRESKNTFKFICGARKKLLPFFLRIICGIYLINMD